jgi:hypothetical protein
MRSFVTSRRISLADDPETGRLLDLAMLIAAGMLSFIVFARVPVHALAPDFKGEFKNHSLLLPTLESTGTTPYSLWYTLQKLLVGHNRDEVVLLNAGWLLLGALAVVKGVVLTGVLFMTSYSRLQALVGGFVLGTAVAMPIPFLERHSRLTDGPVHYLGTLPPNVFMSATQLLANTSAVIALVTLALWFQKPTNARFISMTLMGLLATLAKPGIAPALIATTGVLSLVLVRSRRQDVRTAALRLLLVGVLLGLPLLGAYRGFESGGAFLGLHSELRPFVTWTAYTNRWLIDLIASWAFPIAVVIVVFATRNATRTRGEWLIPAWSVALIATLMFALLAEVNSKGELVYAGNFAWGAMAATSGLYVVSAIAIHGIPWKVRWIPVLVLLLQAIAGLHYINGYIKTGSFL